MKEKLCLLLAVAMLLCTASCQTGETTTSSEPTASVASAVSTDAPTPTPESEVEITPAPYTYPPQVVALQYGAGPVEPSIPPILPVYEEGSITLLDRDEDYGSAPAGRNYRIIYYHGPLEWKNSLQHIRGGDNVHEEPFRVTPRVYVQEGSAELAEMFMVTMIKRYNITRDEMEYLMQQGLEWDLSDADDPDRYLREYGKNEMTEIYNLDIIYTLDNDIINEYYRYR